MTSAQFAQLVEQIILATTMVVLTLLGVWLLSRLYRPDVYTVKDSDGTKISGLPFYIKRGRYVHETVYLETLVEVTLSLSKITTDSENETSTPVYNATRTASLWSETSQTLSELHELVRTLQLTTSEPGDLPGWGAVREKFEALPPYDDRLPTRELPLIGNFTRQEAYVDYDKLYTINAALPLSGSAELAAELNADGTLSKGSAKAEDTTLTALLGALPSTELVALLKPEAKQPDDMGEDTITIRYDARLTIVRHYVRHALSRPAGGPTPLQPIGQSEADSVENPVWYRRETSDISGEPNKPAEEEKPPTEQEAPTPPAPAAI